jgi:hypothetical protein
MTHAEENDEFEGTAEDMELYSMRREAEAEWAAEAGIAAAEAEEEEAEFEPAPEFDPEERDDPFSDEDR